MQQLMVRAEIMTHQLSGFQNKLRHGCPYEAQQSSSSDNALPNDQNEYRHPPHLTPAGWKAGHHVFTKWVIPSLGLADGHAGWGGMGGQRSRGEDYRIIAGWQENSKRRESGWRSEIVKRRHR
jgi:hypothetical protein